MDGTSSIFIFIFGISLLEEYIVLEPPGDSFIFSYQRK